MKINGAREQGVRVRIFALLGSLLLVALFSSIADDSPSAALVKQGDYDDSHGNTKDALIEFQAADRITPNTAAILVRISKEYSDLIAAAKQPADAEKMAQLSLDYAKRAEEIDPASEKTHLALAIGYGRMTDYTDNKTKIVYSKCTKDEVDKALALDPTDDYAYHVLGRWNYAISTLNPVLKLMAKYIYGGVPDASLEDAAANFKKAAALAPQRIMHHYELARVYAALGKDSLADKEWQTIATLSSTNPTDEAEQKEARDNLKKRDTINVTVAKIPALH